MQDWWNRDNWNDLGDLLHRNRPVSVLGEMLDNPDKAPGQAFAAGTPVNAAASALTTSLTGTNNDLVFTAKLAGVSGDLITIEYIDPGAETAEEVVEVVGAAITVTLRNVSSTLSTAAQVKAAIEASPEADALISVANAAANNGTGEVIELAATPLANGVNGTPGALEDTLFDENYLYLLIAANTISTANWRRAAIGAF